MVAASTEVVPAGTACEKRIERNDVFRTHVLVIAHRFRIGEDEHCAANRNKLRSQEEEYEYEW